MGYVFAHRGNQEQDILKRDVTLFRKTGECYRKSKEIHKARLCPHKKNIPVGRNWL